MAYENLQKLIEQQKILNEWRQREYGVIESREPRWWERITQPLETGREWLEEKVGKIPLEWPWEPQAPKIKEIGKGIKARWPTKEEALERYYSFSQQRFDYLAEEISLGHSLKEGDTEFLDDWMQRHTLRPPGFTKEVWAKQSPAAHKAYNIACLVAMIAGVTSPIWTHPSFPKMTKATVLKLYKGKLPERIPVESERMIIKKGKFVGVEPVTTMRPPSVKISAPSVAREFATIQPAIHRTFKYVGLKAHIARQLDDVVAKIKGARPTAVEMTPFYNMADDKIGPAGVLKGVIDPGWIQNVYTQINKELPVMLVNFKPIVPEEEIVAREMEALPKAGIPAEAIEGELQSMLVEVQRGEPGRRIQTETGKWMSQPSTYPGWMGKHRLSKKQVIKAFEKKKDGVWAELEGIARERLEYGYETPQYGRIPSYMEQQMEEEFYAGMPINPDKLMREVKHLIKPEVKPMTGDVTATEKILAHISPTPKKPRNLSLGRLYALTIDELYPLNKYSSIAKKEGIEVLAEEDPFILASQHRGWHGKADTFFHYKTFDVNFNWAGKPLNEILAPIVDNTDYFRAYLLARAQIERHQGGIETGIPLKDAQEALGELEKNYPNFKGIADELNEYQDTLLKYVRDSDLISEDTYQAFKKLNPFYIPFYRVMDQVGRKGLLGRGMVNLPKLYKEIKGSERPIIDPLESVVKNTYVLIDAAERNQVGLSLVKLAEKHPELYKDIIEKIPTPIAPVAQVSIVELQTQLKLDGIEIPDELAEQMTTIFRPSILRPGENKIYIIENGKRSYYEIDPDVYKALTALDRESINFIYRTLALPARFLRLGATTFAPEFVVRNPIRDSITAFCYSRYGFVPGLDTMSGLFSMLKKDEMYWRWKMSGAEHSMLVSLDRKYLRKNVREIIPTKLSQFKNIIEDPLDAAALLSELGEEMTRLGEFKLGMGNANRWYLLGEKIPEDTPLKSRVLEAGNAAREVTLDFARMGAKTKAVNLMIAFWNANVQGTDKLARQMKNKPFKSLMGIATIQAISAYLYLSQKDDPRYQEIPQWQKDIFWIVVTDKHIWRIPKPFELGIIFGTGTERVLQYIDEKDPEVFKELGEAVARGASPGFLPTALVAPIEIAANYSFFLDRPIVSPGLKNLPSEMQYNIYTKETSKLIGEKLGISPKKIEHLVRGWTGGGGILGVETLDYMLKMAGIPEVEPPSKVAADIPLVRGFVVREPIGSMSESVNRFYEVYERSQQGYQAVRELIKDKKLKKITKYAKEYPESQYLYRQILSKTAQNFSQYRRARIAIWKSDALNPEVKKKLIDQIDKQMTDEARYVLRLVEIGKRGKAK